MGKGCFDLGKNVDFFCNFVIYSYKYSILLVKKNLYRYKKLQNQLQNKLQNFEFCNFSAQKIRNYRISFKNPFVIKFVMTKNAFVISGISDV